MPCYLIFAENYPFNPEQVVLTKTWRNEGKIYQETDFFSTEGHLLTSSGCCLTLASMEVVQVIFLFANYLTYKSFAPFVFKIEILQVLRTSCWVLLLVLLMEFHVVVIDLSIFQFSLFMVSSSRSLCISYFLSTSPFCDQYHVFAPMKLH